ncbi:MAG: FecR domain-containing protein [Deltaproteobacteria bacterium]|nr:FecR domain-containing protein [Deltaproteobacteria bacterium]
MRACNRVDEYLDGRLGSSGSAAFERHLSECSGCHAMNEGWRELQLALTAKAAEAEPGSPQPGEATRLVERARERRAPAAVRYDRLFGLAAAAAAGVVLLVVVLSLTSQDAKPAEQPATSPIAVSAMLIVGDSTTGLKTPSVGDRIETPDDGRAVLSLGGDRLGVGPSSALRLVELSGGETRLILERGRVACDVASRDRGASFSVRAASFEVKVRGTRFSVDVDDGQLLVRVVEGTVEVFEDNRRVGLVEAGRFLAVKPGDEPRTGEIEPAVAFELDALLDEQPGPTTSGVETAIEVTELANDVRVEPDVDTADRELPAESAVSGRTGGSRGDAVEPDGSIATWREWVIQGRFDEAEYELESHLSRNASDAAAWSLLADCRRKTGRWGKAVEAYRHVFEHGSPNEANRARFVAGTILQDRLGDSRAAAELYGDYLASSGRKPLAAEVLVRRARCLVDLGRRAAAIGLLEQVVEQHGGSSAAIKARKILGEIVPGSEGNSQPAQ